MEKMDLKKQWKDLYNPSAREFALVDVPELRFLMIDGQGDPNTSRQYQEAVEALYALAYGVKFALKRSGGVDYGVMPLEGLWWAEDMRQFSVDDKGAWFWTMMIMQPDWLDVQLVSEVQVETARKKAMPVIERIRFEPFREGLCAQILYFGAYRDEGPTIARMHEWVRAQGYELSGKHHEIYLGDPRKTAPERLKTVIRQPVGRDQ